MGKQPVATNGTKYLRTRDMARLFPWGEQHIRNHPVFRRYALQLGNRGNLYWRPDDVAAIESELREGT